MGWTWKGSCWEHAYTSSPSSAPVSGNGVLDDGQQQLMVRLPSSLRQRHLHGAGAGRRLLLVQGKKSMAVAASCSPEMAFISVAGRESPLVSAEHRL